MKRTTIYLPDEMKRALEHRAAASGRTEADLIREALAALLVEGTRPRPSVALFDSGDRGWSERADDELVGFGE